MKHEGYRNLKFALFLFVLFAAAVFRRHGGLLWLDLHYRVLLRHRPAPCERLRQTLLHHLQRKVTGYGVRADMSMPNMRVSEWNCADCSVATERQLSESTPHRTSKLFFLCSHISREVCECGCVDMARVSKIDSPSAAKCACA